MATTEDFNRHQKHFLYYSLIVLGFLTACSNTAIQEVPTSSINHIVEGSQIYGPYTIYKLPISNDIQPSNPIQLAMGPDNTLYAANQTGEVYTLHDTDNDGLEDQSRLYCNVKDHGLRSPTGFTHKGDTIYIGTSQQIRAFLDLDKDGAADTSWTFFDDIPYSAHPYEWITGLTFGPDGWLYCALTTDSWNAAPSPDPNGYRGAILKISPDGKKAEKAATGIRSVYGLAFNSEGELFFTDNEGGGNPKEELNRLVKSGFYGHHPTKYKHDSIINHELALETEVAPSGIVFNNKDEFGPTTGDLFVAFYGSGERWTRGGIGRVTIKKSSTGDYEYKEFPVADIPKLSALTFGKDGSLYVAQHGKADYWYNAIYENEGAFYKLVYDPAREPYVTKTKSKPEAVFSKTSVETGKQLFAERACLGCHQVDGTTELLGPNLKDAGMRLTREELLEEITDPSKIIKPSMAAIRVYKNDGKVFLGRIVNSDEKAISLMLIGNGVISIDRSEILKTENEMKSLMYAGLTNGLSETEINSLLDYIIQLNNISSVER